MKWRKTYEIHSHAACSKRYGIIQELLSRSIWPWGWVWFYANIIFTGGLSLQTLDSWKNFINKKDDDFTFKNNVSEIYFEADDIDGFVARLAQRDDIEYIHPLIEHSWGQRAIRFYDPDKHIIEVGENIKLVVMRFMNSGLSIEETAVRMDVAIDFVRSCL